MSQIFKVLAILFGISAVGILIPCIWSLVEWSQLAHDNNQVRCWQLTYNETNTTNLPGICRIDSIAWIGVYSQSNASSHNSKKALDSLNWPMIGLHISTVNQSTIVSVLAPQSIVDFEVGQTISPCYLRQNPGVLPGNDTQCFSWTNETLWFGHPARPEDHSQKETDKKSMFFGLMAGTILLAMMSVFMWILNQQYKSDDNSRLLDTF